jgi:hypothetical protein
MSFFIGLYGGIILVKCITLRLQVLALVLSSISSIALGFVNLGLAELISLTKRT